MARKVVVLGAGATGEAFAAALRRHEPDAEIAVVEHELVGGECSYWACIPSKTLLRPLEVVERARLAPGADAAVSAVDAERVFAWRDEVSEKDDSSQARWVTGTVGAELVRGTAVVAEPGLVRVGERDLPYDALMIATGSRPVVPRIEGLAEVPFWGSREGTSASAVPATLAIVGGGAVGCELAQVYRRLGAEVTLVQNGAHLLPRLDPEAADILADAFREEGVELRFDAKATRVEGGGDLPFRLELEGQEPVEAERLLVATGRKPNVDGLGLEKLGLQIERKGIVVDERLRAGEGVWAAGDVTGVALFTHVGKYQGRIAAGDVAGHDVRADYRAIPAAIFTDPQVAATGDTSGEGAVTASWKVESVARTGTFQKPKRPGLLKLYADPERRVLVGATAVGPEAGEWLGQLTLAIRAEVSVDVLRDTIQPFPTFSEAVHFAARDLPL
ncbi:MAG TPA: NAD(P)/FAD-dependent oxidoreductase [Gaiellaceae bacterium]|nr:NAD(P)/FAD-dependent oxidoreductase [Gaiellaceae bacterium]